MKNAMNPLRLCVAAILCAGLSGCQNLAVTEDGHVRGETIRVEDSSLNWVEFIYIPAQANAGANPLYARNGRKRITLPVRLSLLGSGSISVKTGTSEQVLSDFATGADAESWNDIQEDRINISPEMMRQILQVFVDEGLVPQYPAYLPPPQKLPQIRYVGTIQGTKFGLQTDNPFLVKLVEDFLHTNFAPLLR
ncbi:MAG: hypothetical protein ACI4QT_06610 [Kiritimatiellia bacterium]